MPLDATNFHVLGPVKSVDMRQFYDLFTGGMTDQPVTFRNGLSIGGNQNVATVPLKVYGAVGQTTNLLDLYTDRTAAQPGFGLSAIGSFGWGPGGAAAMDTFMSRIARQNGHADDTAGILVTPNLEVTGNLVAGSLSVSGGGLGTIGATRINFGASGAFIQAYPSDQTYIQLPKLTVTPGTTSLTGLTVNGNTQINGSATVTADVAARYLSTSDGANGIVSARNGSLYLRPSGAGASHVLDSAATTELNAGITRIGGRLVSGGYDPGWSTSLGKGNQAGPITDGRFYQQGNGAAYCIDVTDISVGSVGNKVVQRDGSGQIQVHRLYLAATPNGGGKPARVLGDNNDGWCTWWPASAIGPPATVLVFQGNISGSVAYNNMNANQTTCGIAETFDSIGMNVESGYACRVSRSGWYAMFAVAECNNSVWDSQGNANWRVDALVDGSPQGNRFTTNALFAVESGMARATGWWIGFVAAGQWLGARVWADRFGYAFSFGGRIEFSYIPVTEYPN